jgi:hypothetical protein
MLYVISVTPTTPTSRAPAISRGKPQKATRREARRAHKRQLANRIIRRMWRGEHTRRGRLASAA